MVGRPNQNENQDATPDVTDMPGSDNTERPPGDWQVEPKPFPDPGEEPGTPAPEPEKPV